MSIADFTDSEVRDEYQRREKKKADALREENRRQYMESCRKHDEKYRAEAQKVVPGLTIGQFESLSCVFAGYWENHP